MSFGLTNAAMGEYHSPSTFATVGYYTGTVASIAAGAVCGVTAFKVARGIYSFFKGSSAVSNAVKAGRAVSQTHKVGIINKKNNLKLVEKSESTNQNSNYFNKLAQYSDSLQTSEVIHITPQGVAIPPGVKYKIPSRYIENLNRRGSYGEYENGKFIEKLRIDAATPPGMKGPIFPIITLMGMIHIFVRVKVLKIQDLTHE